MAPLLDMGESRTLLDPGRTIATLSRERAVLLTRAG
jgi:hypothetical protein